MKIWKHRLWCCVCVYFVYHFRLHCFVFSVAFMALYSTYAHTHTHNYLVNYCRKLNVKRNNTNEYNRNEWKKNEEEEKSGEIQFASKQRLNDATKCIIMAAARQWSFNIMNKCNVDIVQKSMFAAFFWILYCTRFLNKPLISRCCTVDIHRSCAWMQWWYGFCIIRAVCWMS